MSDKTPSADRSKDPSLSRSSSNAMWGGRFDAPASSLLKTINSSIAVDRRLYTQDIAGSMAHVRMLAQCSIIPPECAQAILLGLEQVRSDIETNQVAFVDELEDIHMHVENRLREIIGSQAGRLHTARSRNDQVATDLRLWLRDTSIRLDTILRDFQLALSSQAEAFAETILPGFTHLQIAQPVTLGHHLLAYVEMVARDRSRLRDLCSRMNECPLGSAALAGTAFPIDRAMVAKELGFDRPCANSMDAVSDRDFCLEFLGFASISAVHLSRLAEEVIIWCSDPFGFITLPDSLSTGSSIMPQKRNPDGAELVRAKLGRIAGAFLNLCIILKGLPLAYAKDMQEDKEAVFDAADTLELSIQVMTALISTLSPCPDRMRALAEKGFSSATDLADWLVRELEMPFREAHHLTGNLVSMASQRGVRLDELSLEDMQTMEPRISSSVFDVLSVENSVRSRNSFGGTAPRNVRDAARKWIQELTCPSVR